jgi:uncharacterized protein YwqG
MNIKSYIIKNETEYSHELLGILKPSLYIISAKEKSNKVSSKFGGIPDVPKNFEYPLSDNKPLTFLGQILLNDLTHFKNISLIPTDGILYFFIDTNIVNRYPNRKNEFKVIFSSKSNKDDLMPYENNKDVRVINESFLNFFEDYSFPAYQDYEMLQLKKKGIDLDEKIDEIIELKSESLGYISNVGHQAFGNPKALQGTVKFHWSMSKLEYNFPLSEEQQTQVNQSEKEYELLLQVDFSDENLNCSELYGDSVAYFGITREDLKNKNFDAVELCFQNT